MIDWRMNVQMAEATMRGVDDDAEDAAFDATVAVLKQIIYEVGARLNPDIAVNGTLVALQQVAREQLLAPTVAANMRMIVADLEAAPDGCLLDEAASVITTGPDCCPNVEAAAGVMMDAVQSLIDEMGREPAVNGLATALARTAVSTSGALDAAHRLRVLAAVLEAQAMAKTEARH